MYWTDKEEQQCDELLKNLNNPKYYKKIENKIKEIIRNVLYTYYQGQFNYNNTNIIVEETFTEIILKFHEKNDKGNWFTYLSMKAKHLLFQKLIENNENLFGAGGKRVKKDIPLDKKVFINDVNDENYALVEKLIINEDDEILDNAELIKIILIHLVKRKKEIGKKIYDQEKKIEKMVNYEKNLTHENEKNKIVYQIRALKKFHNHMKIVDVVFDYFKKYGYSYSNNSISEYIFFNIKNINIYPSIVREATGLFISYNAKRKIYEVNENDLIGSLLIDDFAQEESMYYNKSNRKQKKAYRVLHKRKNNEYSALI